MHPREKAHHQHFSRLAHEAESHNVERLRRVAVLLRDRNFDEAELSLLDLFEEEFRNAQAQTDKRQAQAYDFFLLVCGRFREYFPEETDSLYDLGEGFFHNFSCEIIGTIRSEAPSLSLATLRAMLTTYKESKTAAP
jgi:hypothetical protein